MDVCDVLLGQPYMWKLHAIYESRPRSFIFTLGIHLYRIPEVVPTTIPPKQCCKVVSQTTKFSFFAICSKGEQKDTATTTALAQEPSIQQKKIDKIEKKCKYSFCTKEYHVPRLVKNFQPFQPQFRENLQHAKQHNFSNKASKSSSADSTNTFPSPWELKIIHTIAS